jgi:O-antigen/teichoic acid export membrane protein
MDVKSSALFKNTIIYAIGNFGSKVLSFGLLPIYSYYLTKEEFGYYDIVLTTIILLVPIITMQLSDGIFRWLIVAGKDKNLINTTITNGFLFVVLSIFFYLFLGLITYHFSPLKYSFLLFILLISSVIYPVIQQTVRGLQQTKLYALSGFLFSVVLLLSNVGAILFFKMNLEALFLASILANAAASLYLFFKIKFLRFVDLKTISYLKIKELLVYSVPLVPNSISWWLIMSANKYIVLYFIGTEALGVYGFANRFPGLLVMVNSIFILAWQESAILNFKDPDNERFFSKIFNLLVKIQFSFAIILILSSEIAIKNLVSVNFYEAWYYLPILYTGAAFSTLGGFYGSMYLGAKDTRGALVTAVVSGISSIVLAVILVKPFGLYGIAIANSLSFVVLFLHRYFHTKKYMNIQVSVKTAFLFPILLAFSIIIVYLNIPLLSIMSILMFSISIIFIFKDILKGLLLKLTRNIFK